MREFERHRENDRTQQFRFAMAALAAALTLAAPWKEGHAQSLQRAQFEIDLIDLTARAPMPPPALPEIAAPFAGDPRLEPIPDHPIFLMNFDAVTTSPGPDGALGTADDVVHSLTMRFTPRVNGQTASEGDGHSDMYVLYDAATGKPIDQPPIIEAIPNGAAGPGSTVPDLTARKFSAIWELHAVVVGPYTDPVTGEIVNYDPTDPDMLIDSAIKVVGPGASPFVRKDIQTNIFLNCPIVPAGTVLDTIPGGPVPHEPKVRDAFFEGQIVKFVPYDIEDGPSNPQVMFDFVDPDGNVLPSGSAPHLVASRAPGDPFYSAIWEIWTVHVPAGFDVTQFKSKATVNASGFRITSSGVRLNCPIVAVDGQPFPFEDPFHVLSRVTAAARGFGDKHLPLDFPPTAFTAPRTNLVTEVSPPLAVPPPADTPSAFPAIDPLGKGNVIPLIMKDPFQLQSSGPSTTGDFIRINQRDLDAAYNGGVSPRLPPELEANFTRLIDAGVLAAEWGPVGIHSYQERLALLGRALFEAVFKPEQGANSHDVTRCLACHSTPESGGAARALYTLKAGNQIIPGRSDLGNVTELNAGSMWGGGGAELLRKQLVTPVSVDPQAGGQLPCLVAGVDNPKGCTTFAHGSKGNIGDLRSVTSGAFNTHVGIQSVEFIVGQQKAALAKGCDTNRDGVVSLAEAATCDLDRDGVVNEMTVGEVTAVTVFFMTLRVPSAIQVDSTDPQTVSLLDAMGITPASADNGRRSFIKSPDQGGASCATCHTPFRPLLRDETVFNLKNPETAALLPIDVPHHIANEKDVEDQFAASVGQKGLRILGDFRLHQMGSQMTCSAGPVLKTAELWDVGSVFPYMRCGNFRSDLRASILAHEGAELTDVRVRKGAQVDAIDPVTSQPTSRQTVTITNKSDDPIIASAAHPLRLVLSGDMSPGIAAANASGTAPGGGLRHGAFWVVTAPGGSLAKGASQSVTLTFANPQGGPLAYDLIVMDDADYSEAAASVAAFRRMPRESQRDLINFLRVQTIDGKIGEGSGGAQILR